MMVIGFYFTPLHIRPPQTFSFNQNRPIDRVHPPPLTPCLLPLVLAILYRLPLILPDPSLCQCRGRWPGSPPYPFDGLFVLPGDYRLDPALAVVAIGISLAMPHPCPGALPNRLGAVDWERSPHGRDDLELCNLLALGEERSDD